MIWPNSSLDQMDIVTLETVPIGKIFFWILLAKSPLGPKSPGSPHTAVFSGTHPPNMCMSLCRSPLQCGLPWWLSGKESPAHAKDMGLIPGSERPSREGNGNRFQHYCLGSLMDRGAWGTIVYEVTKVLDRTYRLNPNHISISNANPLWISHSAPLL